MRDLRRRIESRDAKVVVVGQGYVGLPLSLAAIDAGFRVVGIEVSDERVRSLKLGKSYISDCSDEQVELALTRGFLPTSSFGDCEGFDVAIITVPTPLLDGRPDMSYLEAASTSLAPYLTCGACVIVESTTYPGTTREFVRPILMAGSGLSEDDFLLGYSPERVDPGIKDHRLETTPKIVSGLSSAASSVIEAFFGCFIEAVVVAETCEEAELAKLLENTFRHVNIALINELARFAHRLDINVWRVVDLASSKPFGFMPFFPGPGVGGHCLPIDPSYLSWRVEERLGEAFKFVHLANQINGEMPSYVLERVGSMLEFHGKTMESALVVLLGLAYKANTSDWRESPTATLAELLIDAGCDVKICDPLVGRESAKRFADHMERLDVDLLRTADITVVMVGHDCFDRAMIAREADLVLDTRNFLNGHDYRGSAL